MLFCEVPENLTQPHFGLTNLTQLDLLTPKLISDKIKLGGMSLLTVPGNFTKLDFLTPKLISDKIEPGGMLFWTAP